MPALPYELVADGKTLKTFFDKEEAYQKLIDLSTSHGIECMVKWEGDVEVEAKVVGETVYITDDDGTHEWKLMSGRKAPLKRSEYAKLLLSILEE